MKNQELLRHIYGKVNLWKKKNCKTEKTDFWYELPLSVVLSEKVGKQWIHTNWTTYHFQVVAKKKFTSVRSWEHNLFTISRVLR